MKYERIKEAIFLERPNRFIADVLVDGEKERVHVKNTGRCKELLIPGAEVILAEGNNPARKTKYDLITVRKKGLGWVNIDSQACNAVVKEWLEGTEDRKPEELKDLRLVRPEFVFGASRVDFYLEKAKKKILMEVKGCTLEVDGVGYFPDAPTQRGVKHLHELAQAVEEGMDAYLTFVIAMPKVKRVLPNMQTHPEFGEALREAKAKGLRVLFLYCDISEDEISVVGYAFDEA